MRTRINLRIRQFGGQIQILDPTPGAESPLYKPDMFAGKLEEYFIANADAAISITITPGIYEGNRREILEAMKKYRNVTLNDTKNL